MSTMLFIKTSDSLKACIGLEDDEITLSNFIKQRVCHNVAFAIYIKKVSVLRQKEELHKTQIFHHAKIESSKKKSSKRNQNPSRYYYNSIITNLKFQTQAKISSFKNPHIKK